VIPGDIGRALGVRASGTWRPGPPGPGGGAPGTYATSLPFLLASAAGAAPEEIAAGLAATLRGQDWIGTASVTGGGYLTVTVTARALAALAVRVPAAGAAWAASDALRGTELTAPASADPASAASWEEAWQLVAAWVTGRLAGIAGATVKRQDNFERESRPRQAAPAAAVAFAGPEAIRYALASTTRGRAGRIDASRWARRDLGNPFFAVRYAHARAASVLRWAADLGVDRGPAEVFRPELLSHRAELELLDAISWLPERAASAARRRRPDAFTRYLECLAARWLDCAESNPALPFGGRSAPQDEHEAAARLWLAAAAQTALGMGTRLLGLAAPQRL
jgi:arginyl-tRNA synthetase